MHLPFQSNHPISNNTRGIARSLSGLYISIIFLGPKSQHWPRGAVGDSSDRSRTDVYGMGCESQRRRFQHRYVDCCGCRPFLRLWRVWILWCDAAWRRGKCMIKYIWATAWTHGGRCPLPPLLFWRISMITSSNGNIFRVTNHLYGDFTGHRGIPRTSDAELWCFLWSVPQ